MAHTVLLVALIHCIAGLCIEGCLLPSPAPRTLTIMLVRSYKPMSKQRPVSTFHNSSLQPKSHGSRPLYALKGAKWHLPAVVCKSTRYAPHIDQEVCISTTPICSASCTHQARYNTRIATHAASHKPTRLMAGGGTVGIKPAGNCVPAPILGDVMFPILLFPHSQRAVM